MLRLIVSSSVFSTSVWEHLPLTRVLAVSFFTRVVDCLVNSGCPLGVALLLMTFIYSKLCRGQQRTAKGFNQKIKRPIRRTYSLEFWLPGERKAKTLPVVDPHVAREILHHITMNMLSVCVRCVKVCKMSGSFHKQAMALRPYSTWALILLNKVVSVRSCYSRSFFDRTVGCLDRKTSLL